MIDEPVTTDTVMQRMGEGLDRIDRRFDALDLRLVGIDERLERSVGAITGDLADLREAMLSARSFAGFATDSQTRLRSLADELRDIRRGLEALTRQVAEHSGFTKEIDHALDRLAAIERHLGIDRKIVA